MIKYLPIFTVDALLNTVTVSKALMTITNGNYNEMDNFLRILIRNISMKVSEECIEQLNWHSR